MLIIIIYGVVSSSAEVLKRRQLRTKHDLVYSAFFSLEMQRLFHFQVM